MKLNKGQLFRKLNHFYKSKKLVWIIISFGILLRLIPYLLNRSLWLDESMLALNIGHRSFLELLQPLEFAQAAPLGFLMLEKLAVQIFGNNEYALRLVPLFAGIISAFLFCKIAKCYIAPKAVPIALGLFAISSRLIYYSSEVRPYSSDVAITLLLILMTAYIQSKPLTPLRIALFGAIGTIAIWFSFPSVFVLAGVGMCLALFCLFKKEWKKLKTLSIIYVLWTLSFAIYYLLFLSNLINQVVRANFDVWSTNFAPFPPLSLADVKWFIGAFFYIFENPVGISLIGLGALSFLVGCLSLFSENKKRFLILISPVFFALFASALHKYTFEGRFLLFLVPFTLLFVAQGVGYICDKTKYNPAIAVTLIGLLFYHPLVSASSGLIKPQGKEEIKPVLNYLQRHKQNGDVLYLYYSAYPAFKYYAEKWELDDINYIKSVKSRENWDGYRKDLYKLRGNKRVWILFSHADWIWEGVEEERLFLHYLDNIGKRMCSFKATNAALYLYDLSSEIAKGAL